VNGVYGGFGEKRRMFEERWCCMVGLREARDYSLIEVKVILGVTRNMSMWNKESKMHSWCKRNIIIHPKSKYPN
jgi:hypothetical protein